MTIRMMLLAGLLAVPGLAVADDYGTDTETEQDSMDQTGQMGDTDAGMEQGSDIRTAMPGEQQQVEIFKNKDNFKVKGTVSSVDSTQNMITLQRENLPPLQLQVAQGTDIKYDGRRASLQQLQPGSEVRAEFNVAQDQPVAVALDAKPSKAMKKGEHEMEKGMEQMEKGANEAEKGMEKMNQ